MCGLSRTVDTRQVEKNAAGSKMRSCGLADPQLVTPLEWIQSHLVAKDAKMKM